VANGVLGARVTESVRNDANLIASPTCHRAGALEVRNRNGKKGVDRSKNSMTEGR